MVFGIKLVANQPRRISVLQNSLKMESVTLLLVSNVTINQYSVVARVKKFTQ